MMQERAKSYKRVFGTNLTNLHSVGTRNSSSKKTTALKCSPPSRLQPSLSLYEYLKTLDKNREDGQYFKETNVTKVMRGILVEWIVNVHRRFKLAQETLFNCISYLDRVLSSSTRITPQELQLLGITSLWVASKYEQVYSPPLKHFIQVTDNAYSKNDLLRMEEAILKCIEFNLTRPTRFEMVRKEMDSLGMAPHGLVYSMCSYLTQLSILEIWDYREQDIAKGCIYLATRIFKKSGSSGSNHLIDTSQTVKNVAYSLTSLLGSNAVSVKYDCDEYQYVGGYTIAKKQ